MARSSNTAVVIGASGQDGYFLTRKLLNEGWQVHAITRRPEELLNLRNSAEGIAQLSVHRVDLAEPAPLFELIGRSQPAEIYNLAGQSSVFQSFREPLRTWQSNAHIVAMLLEAVRTRSPESRFYQASSTDMFGGGADESVVFNENSPLRPESPYAGAKASAHLLCRNYRSAYSLRIACGILSNHESHRRPAHFLTRKITDHVRAVSGLSGPARGTQAPLVLGNLKVQRDWGFAPDYVDGMTLILRQINIRSLRGGKNAVLQDEGPNYRDYVLGTGQSHAVWELVDTAFRIADLQLDWDLETDDPARWSARFSDTGTTAVTVNPEFLRPCDPFAIRIDPSSAREQLGWSPGKGIELFLKDMLTGHTGVPART
jgi:GDPmannose 4,6-dehydratase